MKTIALFNLTGVFAENKDIAREIRTTTIQPGLEKGESFVLDFSKVEGATQSFIHALISEPIRIYGPSILDRIYFKDCNPVIQEVITIVTEYMQEAENED